MPPTPAIKYYSGVCCEAVWMGDKNEDELKKSCMFKQLLDMMPNDAAVMELIAELYQKLHMKYKDQDYDPMQQDND